MLLSVSLPGKTAENSHHAITRYTIIKEWPHSRLIILVRESTYII